MATTGYVALKNHFDKLIRGGYPSNGLERIRDVYEDAFGKKINLYDVYQSPLRMSGNPISAIITLIGPDDDLKYGIMPCNNDIVYVSVMTNEYLKGIDKNNINSYIEEVFSTMRNIIWADRLANNISDTIRINPYCEFLHMCAFYFTFHHIDTCFPDMINASAFNDILEKYFCVGDDIEKVIHSLRSNKFSADFESIYSTMTCKNTVDLFY